MSELAKTRLGSVVLSLTRMDDFSSDDAEAVCHETSPDLISQTIGRLVRAGVLRQHIDHDDTRYRWAEAQGAHSADDDQAARRTNGNGLVSRTTLPRDRLLASGPDRLSNAELLAILIRAGGRKESALEGGRQIASRFSDCIEALAQCSQQELHAVSATATNNSYAQIMAGIELGRRIAFAQMKRRSSAPKITSTRAAVEFCRLRFARLATEGVQEQFHVVSLNTKHTPIQTHCITVGTLNASLVHPREVFRPAIRDAASAILLVHNHPSGDPQPSREDRLVTDQLTEAGRLLGIDVLDHVIVARDACLSIREHAK